MEHVHELKVNKDGQDAPIVVWSDDSIAEFLKYEEYYKDASSFEINFHIRNQDDVDNVGVLLAKLDRCL